MGDSELTPSEVLDLESDGINNKVSTHCLPLYCATVVLFYHLQGTPPSLYAD